MPYTQNYNGRCLLSWRGVELRLKARKTARRWKFLSATSALLVVSGHLSTTAVADTLYGALAQAYRTNPQITAERALVRATDETVPAALSGYRPRISATGSVGVQTLSTTSSLLEPLGFPAQYSTQSGHNTPHSVGITAIQNLFDGFQTANRTREAESQVSQARQALRDTVQKVLLAAATAYMDLLRNSALLELQKRNVEVLQEQLRNTRERFRVGEVTETDVDQAKARLSGAQAQLYAALSNYRGAVATYKRIIGSKPRKPAPGSPVDRFLPKTLTDAIAVGLRNEPSVLAAEFNVDVAEAQVKVAQGALSPQVQLQLNAQKAWEPSLSLFHSFTGSALIQMSVPIYQGGSKFAAIRQAKETLGQRRDELELAQTQIRGAIVQAWEKLKATQVEIPATEAEVKAAESALNGVREEARVGQRTTLDVLNAQQELVNARAALVTAQRDRVLASYTLLSAVGRLSPQVLGLPTSIYRPAVHYRQVRDAWAGTRTPSGR